MGAGQNHFAAAATPQEYDAIDSPLSDLGKPNKSKPAPTKLMAVSIDVAQNGSSSSPQGIETGKWSTGLCNCFDFCVPNCLMVWLCPCISAAQIASRLGFKFQTALIAFGGLVAIEYILYCVSFATVYSTEEDYYYGYYYYETTYSINIWGYISFLASIVLFIAFWQLRTKVRERFQLPGSCVEDFFVTFCCSCCALAQMATHVKSYKPRHCDFGPPDELPAYGAEV